MALLGGDGDLVGAVADMDCFDELSGDHTDGYAPGMCVDVLLWRRQLVARFDSVVSVVQCHHDDHPHSCVGRESAC